LKWYYLIWFHLNYPVYKRIGNEKLFSFLNTKNKMIYTRNKRKSLRNIGSHSKRYMWSLWKFTKVRRFLRWIRTSKINLMLRFSLLRKIYIYIFTLWMRRSPWWTIYMNITSLTRQRIIFLLCNGMFHLLVKSVLAIC
jgi:hypothetical protein